MSGTTRLAPPEEGLLAPGTIRLFGNTYRGLQIGEFGASPASNHPLARALRESKSGAPKPMLARIYGFTYLGNYFKLSEPLVFLVFGEGTPLNKERCDQLATTGIEFTSQHFSEGVLMWACDQLDMAVRIDVTVGWMKDLLLATELTGDSNITGGDTVRRSDIMGDSGFQVGRGGDSLSRPRRG